MKTTTRNCDTMVGTLSFENSTRAINDSLERNERGPLIMLGSRTPTLGLCRVLVMLKGTSTMATTKGQGLMVNYFYFWTSVFQLLTVRLTLSLSSKDIVGS